MPIIFKDMMRGSETFSPYIPTYGMDGERRNCMEDTDIIELYWSRSQEAIRETKKKYDKLCSHIADRILHSREDAEECVQDTYLAVWNRIPEERPSYFRAFLCKITRNIATGWTTIWQENEAGSRRFPLRNWKKRFLIRQI